MDATRMTDQSLSEGLRSSPARPQYPIQLNESQEAAVKLWAADDRLWTAQDTVEFNLRTFVRKVLAEVSSAPPAQEQAIIFLDPGRTYEVSIGRAGSGGGASAPPPALKQGTAEQAEQWTNAPEWVRALYLRWSVSSRLETQHVLDDLLASAASAPPTALRELIARWRDDAKPPENLYGDKDAVRRRCINRLADELEAALASSSSQEPTPHD
jgi:hypothetical protein